MKRTITQLLKSFTLILATIASFSSIWCQAQDAVVKDSLTTSNQVPNLIGVTTGAVTTGANYIYNGLKGLDFSQGFDASVSYIQHGSLSGGGVTLMTALTNNPIQAGVGIYSLQEYKVVGGVQTSQKEWSLYTVNLQLAIQQRETIPLLNIPIDILIGTGAGLKISGNNGNEIIEHSEILGKYNYQFSPHGTFSIFAGVIHESEYPSDVMKVIGGDVTWQF